MIRAAAARRSVNAIFLLHGIILANWLTRIPAVQHRFGLSMGALGAYLLATSIGALCGMPVAARLVGIYGSARIVRISTLLFCLWLPAPGLLNHAWMLAPALFVFGWNAAMMEVSMNTQAVIVERHMNRPVMTTFHALFSIGGMVGSGMGGGAAALGLSPAAHLSLAALLLVLPCLFAVRALLPDVPAKSSPEPVHWTRHAGALWALGAIAFCILIGEGAMADWTTVYLNGIPGVTAGVAAIGYAVFSICMAIGRLSGDHLRSRFSEITIIRCGASLAAVGLGLGLALGGLAGGLLGFACAGFGFSSIFPILTMRSGQVPGISPQAGIATVTALGYSGFLAGPPIIGFAAQISSLRIGLVLIPLLSAAAALLSGKIPGVGRAQGSILTAEAAG
ncbi:MAG TPA: MFS transporter [Bryobacteraceae bacterium]|jgi:predicted MFS family arabinose efflux permease|nr:MFS transporter [Bryobacteraceae bacterium]HVW08679.1 MFS transporter [Bryobacteraceae bacterium]